MTPSAGQPAETSALLPSLEQGGEQLYRPQRVAHLFNQMSATYGWINLITSFGFSWLWRKQCVQQLNLQADMQVYDLMSGMGECWHPLLPLLQGQGKILAVDFSEGMMQHAAQKRKAYPDKIELFQADLLDSTHNWPAADAVVSCFGLKTFSPSQQAQFARQLGQFLKPGSRFSLLEISVPEFRPLRLLYMFYLKHLIPLLGRLLLGNPDHYRLLGVYAERFGDARHFCTCLQAAGFQVSYQRYFFGCATGVVGQKL